MSTDTTYVIVRTESAGAFAGYLADKDLAHGLATLTEARRLWYWAGAASLSGLATEGTSKPAECKFPVPVVRVQLAGVVEIIDVTPVAQQSIEGVPVWTA